MSDKADIVFLDFEASSLNKEGYPVEVAWVFASGGEESYLIRPAPTWTDWAAESEATHHLPREKLVADGVPHDEVANRMLTALAGYALYATAPSWDGQWLSRLLRGAGLPRHALRVQDSDIAHENAIIEALKAAHIPEAEQARIAKDILSQARLKDDAKGEPAHRALADARRELEIWREVKRLAETFAKDFKPAA